MTSDSSETPAFPAKSWDTKSKRPWVSHGPNSLSSAHASGVTWPRHEVGLAAGVLSGTPSRVRPRPRRPLHRAAGSTPAAQIGRGSNARRSCRTATTRGRRTPKAERRRGRGCRSEGLHPPPFRRDFWMSIWISIYECLIQRKEGSGWEFKCRKASGKGITVPRWVHSWALEREQPRDLLR